MSDESKSSGIESQRTQHPHDGLSHARRKHRLKQRQQQIEQQRVANESINTLLSVVTYLNRVQDGDGLRIEGNYDRTDIDRRSRILNCHEEDIMNASLITMKRLIETILPGRKHPQRHPQIASEPAVPGDRS